MQYRLFAIPATGSPDLEEELNCFLRSHRVLSVQRSVERIDGAPRWCFCVEYLENGLGQNRPKGKRRGDERIDYREVLSEEDFAVYVRLREVRKELAAAEAIPVYAVCTNEQLAAMARERPDSLGGMKRIEGFGEAKAAKYGEAFMKVLPADKDDNNEKSGSPD